jgi:hypothetical protein
MGVKPSAWWRRSCPLLVGLLVGALWTFFIYDAGIRFSRDSTVFMSHALNMGVNGTFSVPVNRAPLYIVLLGAFLWIEPLPGEAAALISGAALTVVLTTLVLILRRLMDDIILVCLFLLVLVTWAGPLHVFTSAYTEQVMAACLILNFYLVLRHLETGRLRYYALAAACVAAAALTRYAAYFLIAVFLAYTSAYCVHECRRKAASARVVIRYLLLGSICWLPPAAYLVRNYCVANRLHGNRQPADISLSQNLGRLADVWTSDVSVLLTVLAILAPVGVALRFRGAPAGSKRRLCAYAALCATACLVAYCALLLHATTRWVVDPINTRYLSPVYFYVVILAASGCGACFANPAPPSRGFVFARHWLVRCGVCALPALVCVANMPGLHKSLASITNRRFGPTGHQHAGFNWSPTSAQIGAWLADAIKEQDMLHVTAMTDAVRPHVNRSILFRRRILHDAGLNRFGTWDVRDFDYTLTALLDTRSGSIAYHNLPPLRKPADLTRELADLMRRAEIQTLYLLYDAASRHTDSVFGSQDLSGLSTEDVSLEAVANPAPYVVYKCNLRHAP